MTERYYYANSMAFTCTAAIEKISLDRCTVLLNRTIFFPGGGGQPGDRGTLDGIEVEQVHPSANDPTVLCHKLSYPLPSGTVKGNPVICNVDARHRWDYMQQHTGQHLISAILLRCLGVQTVSVHQGSEVTTIETDTSYLSDGDILKIEDTAQEVISQKRPVTYRVVDDSALPALALRRKTSRTGRVRLVEIQDYDRVACGGVHLPDTGWIQLVKIAGVERIRGHIRLSLKIGERALNHYRCNYDTLKAAGELLSAHQDAVPERIQALQEEVRHSHRTIRLQRERIARMILHNHQAKDTPGPLVIPLEDEEAELFQAVVEACNELDQDVCITHCTTGADTCFWGIVATGARPHSPEQLKNMLLKPHNARGGGNALRWQGIVPAGNITSFVATWRNMVQPST